MSTPEGQPEPSEEEIRAALEQQMREIRVEDLLVQSIASLLNLSARRIAKEDERDLAQAQLGIEAVRSLVDILPEEAATQVRNALSELQMLFAQAAGGEAGPGGEGEDGPDGGGGGGEPPRPPTQPPPGPSAAPGREPPPKLWTPGR